MKKILLLILFLSIQIVATAQNSGSISGKLITPGGSPAEGITVMLTQGNFATLTDLNGDYILQNLPLGSHMVVARGLGFKEVRREVLLSADAPAAILNITLTASSNALQEVEVLGRKETSYKSEYSFIGTKTASLVIDVPQTISTVTKELMEDQQAYRLTDVVKNIAGVNLYTHYDDMTVRGFRNGYESGYRLLNGMRSGYSYGNGFFRIPVTANIERVEVLKGPGAALFGDINPGGTINMVTKKPLEEERKAVSFSVGSFNTVRTALDFTGPLNENQTMLYRLNFSYEDTETFRDIIDNKSLLIAPTVTFLPTDKTTINAELVYSNFDGYLDRGLVIRGGDLFGMPFSSALNQPSDYFKINDFYLNASLNHGFTDWLSFNASYLKFTYSEDLSEHRTGYNFLDAPANTIMDLRYYNRVAEEYTNSFSGYFTLNANTGAISHKIAVGADYIEFNTDKNSSMWEARQQLIDGKPVQLSFDLNNPFYELRDPSKYIRRPLPSWFTDYINAVYNTTGIYVQDQVDLTSRLSMLGGLRYEMFRDERDYGDGEEQVLQSVLLPRLGLTYSILDNLNYFASYSQGFKPLKPEFIKFPERYGSQEPFKNETSYQIETGLKGEFFNKGLFATLSLYQIEKKNMLVNTAQLTLEGNPIYRQNGKARSQGAELELSGTLRPNLSLNFNYAYNRTEVLESSVAVENGMPLANAPEHAGGLWAKYTFDLPALRGLGFAVGGQHMSRRRMESQVNDIQSGEMLWSYWPSYTTLDAALFYNINKFKFNLNMNNLLDEKYFVGGYDYYRSSPGAPRNFMATIGYTF
ncbi:TonB-dependent receptor [uncultured Pontibacter sp.]|uniref:TonB-dependent receptor n=1 Tax=uncultured Pontibacter sp. TaxID=453356 RepID=UPI0026276E80|nr:TonB-dependent receptor [uncultured Pontibacter sp.]